LEEEVGRKHIITYEEYIGKFQKMIRSLGLNNSMQREYVLKVLFDSEEHLSAEEVLQRVKEQYRVKIGVATVYRILNLLEDMQVVNALSLKGMDSMMYELNLSQHHDHMVCKSCGAIAEFHNKQIEQLQEKVAAKEGFTMTGHTMVLYGICPKCRKEGE
jgi:Fur family ferric uptake transcriptional regulator